nr:uncharacterized protein LOC111509102 isoform X2 [Leptinotarsa decemlineata]
MWQHFRYVWFRFWLSSEYYRNLRRNRDLLTVVHIEETLLKKGVIMDEKAEEASPTTDTEPVPIQPVEPDPGVTDASDSTASAGMNTNAEMSEPMETNLPISDPTDQSTELAISAATEELLETLTSEAPTSTEIFTSEAGITSHVTSVADACMSSDALSVEAVLMSGEDVNPDKDFTTAMVETPTDEPIVDTSHVESVDSEDAGTKQVTEKQILDPVCTLEEELQRLHEGDPPVEESVDKQVQETELSKKPVVEDENSDDVEKTNNLLPRSSRFKVKVEEPVETSNKMRKHVERNNSIDKASNILEKTLKSGERKGHSPAIRVVQTPIMKDSELEEMLSADEILSDRILIKDSQEDIGTTDLFICGKCHETFNLSEEFQKHKARKCSTKSNLLSVCANEGQPEIWAYTLWKNKQLKVRKPGIPSPSSWDIFRKWVQLAQSNKNPWLSAGETLQFCSKISTAQLMENNQLSNTDTDLKQLPKPVQLKKPEQLNVKKIEHDPLALDGFGDNNKENSTIGNLKKSSVEVRKPAISKPPMKLVKEVILPAPKVNSNKAMRTMTSVEKGEYAVERIVAKRFNAKKKNWEYQIKWEHFPSEDNTWEPIENLNHCKLMVDEFEKQLTKLKAEKAQQQAANLVKSRSKILNTSSLTTPGSSSANFSAETPNRPTRTSKQKALNQVKAWCGNISDEENPPVGAKRPRSPDSDDSFEKRMKFEEFSDDSDTPVKFSPPRPQFRKIAPKPQNIQVVNNGIGKSTTLPPNVLIPDANGVVRINQKQLPSLSTGVYIMSKTAGIIKLDSTTSKVSTSNAGQTIVKVAPKIGQTQIKIVKKEGPTSTTRQVIQVTPNKNVQTTPTKPLKPVLKAKKPIEIRTPVIPRSPDNKKPTEVMKKVQETHKKSGFEKMTTLKKLPDQSLKPSITKVLNKKEERKPATLLYPESPKKVEEEEEESDDGLEELPFPDEIKIPEPESPTSEFTLDPFTGKIAGQEYPDIPDPEPIEESKYDSLDNIVKLAAADITEEDLKNEPPETPMEIEDPIGLERGDEDEELEEKVMVPAKNEQVRKILTAPPTRTVVRMSVLPKKGPSSILNKALTGQQGVRKSILHNTSTPKVNQRILNPSVARSPQVMNPIIKPISSYVRTKPVAPKPRQVLRPHHDTSPKHVYTFPRTSPAANMRKIGNTTIRSATSPVARPQPRMIHSNMNVMQRTISPKKEPTFIRGQPERVERKVVPSKPKTVISMPSLIGDDDLIITPPKVVQPPKPQSPSLLTSTGENEAPALSAEDGNQEETALIPISKQEPEEESTVALASEAQNDLTTDMSAFTLADNENPIFITGDDGTVYQVAGQNEQGQTILLTQGSDGQQQCLLVTNEVAEAVDPTAITDEVPPQPETEMSMTELRPDVTEQLSIKTDPTESNDQVVAQVVRAEPPSPGGTHKVVVMLPDGNLMVTQVSPEEFASLELE